MTLQDLLPEIVLLTEMTPLVRAVVIVPFERLAAEFTEQAMQRIRFVDSKRQVMVSWSVA